MAANTRNKKATQKHQGVARDGYFAIHFKQAKSSLAALWSRPLGNILTLAVISMALTLPASLYLLGKNIAVATTNVAGPSHVSGYIKEQTPEPRIMVLKDELESLPEVAAVDYISPQQGLDDLSQYSGFDQAISLLDDYALPGVLVITPTSDDKQAVQALAQRVRAEDEISDVRLDEDWFARLDAIKNLVGGIVMTLSVLMLGSVFLIVGNTLRFNVQANKDEIQTMKLIGATDSFILRPYLYSGMWFGLLGAISAWILTALITILLNSSVEQLALLYDSRFRLIGLSWDESLLLLMLGTFLGCLAAKVSAQRHLNEIEPV
ncbi:permease-like cell division protein FtsX [Vibrio scophthalmi]|uniref:Cell division protein FtsX n=2 Tax=Vibrio scophthalmi TaxID=45658 RepID=A0A1B1NJJ7_9VIBR|nr:permease-like cell division protein FtsX [Vibrio scophthalmi]ANS83865.1 Cell division protein FtsX [Vibrio scophthalmi]ANU38008.1 Cell division protein FtsX [Vibrio scophthalmi]EGU30011.1 cell division protein FtsX [Vibrio scophthalmi LMG 19158]MCY9805292.1 permease-like cell division protein FtsX [Vibrio scophthalmi]ODS12671.1 Cell division protein FtsX [Vibrio scophthalmi]